MKKDQIKSRFKEMKGNAKEVAGKVIEIREPGYPGNIQNAHGNIAAAYAALQNEYKKAG
ncbi:MAG: CsbD family protein [Azonexaceae bacterium]|nr:CsbD family protein [Azonexaceae bacterium]